jgi:hypothetical protein
MALGAGGPAIHAWRIIFEDVAGPHRNPAQVDTPDPAFGPF